jgi:hypothetical protein
MEQMLVVVLLVAALHLRTHTVHVVHVSHPHGFGRNFVPTTEMHVHLINDGFTNSGAETEWMQPRSSKIVCLTRALLFCVNPYHHHDNIIPAARLLLFAACSRWLPWLLEFLVSCCCWCCPSRHGHTTVSTCRDLEGLCLHHPALLAVDGTNWPDPQTSF